MKKSAATKQQARKHIRRITTKPGKAKDRTIAVEVKTLPRKDRTIAVEVN